MNKISRPCDHCPRPQVSFQESVACSKCEALVCPSCAAPRAHSGLCKLCLEQNSDIDTIIEGALAHGAAVFATGVTDPAVNPEADDLTGVLKDAWELLTLAQRKDLMVQDSVRNTLRWLLEPRT